MFSILSIPRTCVLTFPIVILHQVDRIPLAQFILGSLSHFSIQISLWICHTPWKFSPSCDFIFLNEIILNFIISGLLNILWESSLQKCMELKFWAHYFLKILLKYLVNSLNVVLIVQILAWDNHQYVIKFLHFPDSFDIAFIYGLQYFSISNI